MDFKASLKEYGRRIEAGLREWVPPADERPGRLHQAMRHSLDAGGKRVRPTLLLAAADTGGEPLANPVPAAVAVECLHTYSLIHDDLPCMDDSDLRRGRPSCHVRFDEATAVLAGDALLTHAFWLLGHAYIDHPRLAASLVVELGQAAGSRCLIGGQMADMEAQGGRTGPDLLDYIHANKTAALIESSLVMGGMTAGTDPDGLATLRKVGRHLGLAFQIMDDILDAVGSGEKMGKMIGNDAKKDKLTFPGLHGMEAARAAARKHSEDALRHCGNLPGHTAFLRELIRWLAVRNA